VSPVLAWICIKGIYQKKGLKKMLKPDDLKKWREIIREYTEKHIEKVKYEKRIKELEENMDRYIPLRERFRKR